MIYTSNQNLASLPLMIHYLSQYAGKLTHVTGTWLYNLLLTDNLSKGAGACLLSP